MQPINLADFERLAALNIDPIAWDYYSSGSDDELTLRENRAALERLSLQHKVLVDVSKLDTTTTVLGDPVSMPVLVAPTALHRLAHRDGEVATARAAKASSTLMILSTLSSSRVEDVVVAADGPVWFQLYVYKDRDATRRLVERVAAAGCKALVLTVDAPVLGRRERDARNGFTLPEGMAIENLLPDGMGSLPTKEGESGLAAYFAALIDPSLDWDDLAWLASLSKLPLVLKGVVRADDARRARDAGVAGLVVSNHGGRQLDGGAATIDVIGEVADAVGKDVEVYLDGGIRRGTDVVKALALGARAVLLGRPILWGLGADGEAGVHGVLETMRSELHRAMALCGCPTLAAIDRSLVLRRG